MIILNYSPDLINGGEHMLALLFDMNKLWEEYVFRMLLRSKRDDILVSSQNKQKFWEVHIPTKVSHQFRLIINANELSKISSLSFNS
jgi:5-methylcytosine-specific restriction endonuclease McrBC regulatory subunit McrC